MGSVLGTLGQSYRITKDALGYIFSYPKMLVPTLVIKVFYVAGYLAILIYTPLLDVVLGEVGLSLMEILLILYLTIVYFRFFEGLIALVTLQLVKQQSENYKMSLLKAIWRTLVHSLLKTFPIILFWSVIEFVIAVVFAIIKGLLRGKDGDDTMLSRAADRTQRLLNNMLDRVSLLSFPAIVWDNMRTIAAIKEGLTIFKGRFGVIFSGTIIGGLFYLVMSIPAAVVFFLGAYFEFLNIYVLVGIFIYALVIWSIKFLIEVLFSTKIYLWHRAWSNARLKAIKEGKEEPEITDIPQPNLLTGYSSVFLDVKFKRDKDQGPEPMSQY